MNDNGKRLAEARGTMSRAAAASALGIGRSTLSMYEHGHRTPNDSIKIKMAKLYGRSIEELFFAHLERENDWEGGG